MRKAEARKNGTSVIGTDTFVLLLPFPQWAQELWAVGAPIDHVFSHTFQLQGLQDWQHTAVIGGGSPPCRPLWHSLSARPAVSRWSYDTRSGSRSSIPIRAGIGALYVQEFEQTVWNSPEVKQCDEEEPHCKRFPRR